MDKKKKKRVKLAQVCTVCMLWLFVFIGEKDEKGRNCLGYFRVAQWRTQGMMISKLKFGLNIKQNISVMSSVQLSDIPKIDAVEIQDTCIFCLEDCFVSFKGVKLTFHVFKKCL